MTLLDIRQLNISALGVPLVKNVSFSMQKGEIMAVVGESGSGKTLTALSVMGLLPAALDAKGEIAFEGQVIKSAQAVRALRGSRIGMIFQEPMTSLNPLHTIGKQIGEAVRVHQRGLSPAKVKARVCDLLDKVGLKHFADRLDAYPHQLSGGERQRVMIAMAIANDPALLIADEPTTALDVTIQAQILSLIDELRKRLGMAVLLITHDLPLVRRIADRVGIMSKGELVETGVTKEIFDAPKHPYTRMLLGSEPGPAPAAPKEARETLMRSENLSVSFAASQGLFARAKQRSTVLQDVNVNVSQGTTLGIVGESGSGKTSLALALLRLVPSTGGIWFEGAPIEALKGAPLRQKRRDMQIVFQDPYSSLNPRMNIGAIILEGLGVHEPRSTPAEKEARLDALLQEVGLEANAKERYPHEFSGGQRQRISIARALILKPKLLVLDEPTSALDRTVQKQILDLLLDLQRKYGLTYLFISHDLRVVRAISHRIMVLRKGRVVEEGDAKQIFERPQDEYTKALIKAAML